MASIVNIINTPIGSGSGDKAYVGANKINSNFANLNADKLETGGFVGTAQTIVNLIPDCYTKTQSDARYLGISGKSSDSDKLDGLNSTQFLRSDQNDSTSGVLTAASFLTSGGYARTSHNKGHLIGGYNNIAANGQYSNPIYTVGSFFVPNESDLGNMYGIGHANGAQASFLNSTDLGASPTDWGLYVSTNGVTSSFIQGDGNAFFKATVNAGNFKTGNWEIDQSGTSLVFKYNGATQMTLQSNGNLTVNKAFKS